MAKKKKAATPAKMLRIRITARQVVHYDQIVEMTPDEWERFKRESPSTHTSGGGGGDLVGGWLNEDNIYDADDIDEDGFEAVVIDEHGKAVIPSDAYTGAEE